MFEETILLALTVALGRCSDKGQSLLTFISISDCDRASVLIFDSEDAVSSWPSLWLVDTWCAQANNGVPVLTV